MTGLHSFYADHGAEFNEYAGRTVVQRYQRPARTHQAVRNGVGVIEMPYGILVIEGSDRISYVNNVITNQIPEQVDSGRYSFLLDPHGRIQTDLYIYNAPDRLLLFTPPGKATEIADSWEVFIEDVTIRVASDAFTIFGVHGPTATEKIASVLTGTTPPTARLSIDRGSIGESGVTVIRSDDITGEESYEVICTPADERSVLDRLLNQGPNAVLFGRHTWETLTAEAGTPLFETELAGRIPNVVGIRDAVDFTKGCFVGQEVVSKVENRGQPSQRLVGLHLDAIAEPESVILADESSIGQVTRSVQSPSLESAIGLAFINYRVPDTTEITVRIGGSEVPAQITTLPFVSGSSRSARIPEVE